MLVLIVILLFLQDWRAVLVPATTVPVTIIGAFAGMAAVGFSVNLLTLFGLVLAIGIVVDDAIVIVENAAHHIERGLNPRDATIQAMDEVTGPVIGITLVLMAVFLPTAFLGGITGQLYRQFALTIAITALISAVNALTLKPAQCAVYLRPAMGPRNAFFRAFNADLRRGAEHAYVRLIGAMVGRPGRTMLAFVALIAVTVWWLHLAADRFPAGRGSGLRDRRHSASRRRLSGAHAAVVEQVNRILAELPGVADWIQHRWPLGARQYDRLERRDLLRHLRTLGGAHRPEPEPGRDPREPASAPLGDPGGLLFAFAPPSIRGLGVAGGFQMQLQDRGGVGLPAAPADGRRDGPRRQRAERARGAQLHVPRWRSAALRRRRSREGEGRSASRSTGVFDTLQAYLGSAYVNDFNRFGRTYQVRVAGRAGRSA